MGLDWCGFGGPGALHGVGLPWARGDAKPRRAVTAKCAAGLGMELRGGAGLGCGGNKGPHTGGQEGSLMPFETSNRVVGSSACAGDSFWGQLLARVP